jgi:hypothetical protein
VVAEQCINHCCGDAVIGLAVVVRDRRIEISLARSAIDGVGGKTQSLVDMPLPLAKLLVSALDETIEMVGAPDESDRMKGSVICQVSGEALGGAVVVVATDTDRGVELAATVTTPDRGEMTLPLPTECSAFTTRDVLLDLLLVATCLQGPLEDAVHGMSDEPTVEVNRNPEQITGARLALVKWPTSPELMA